MRDRPYILCFVAVVLLLYSLIHLSAATIRKDRAEAALASLINERDSLRRENERLHARLDGALTDSEIEAMARERLGLLMPDEQIFTFADK